MASYTIEQFENGNELLKNIDSPLNIYINCSQLPIMGNGQSRFQTATLDIPPHSVDWRQVKLTVNGVSYYENQSFTRSDDGFVTWIDKEYKLQAGDIIFIQWTAKTVAYNGDTNTNWLEVDDTVLTFRYGNVIYPLFVSGLSGIS